MTEQDIRQFKAIGIALVLIIFYFMITFANHAEALRETIKTAAGCTHTINIPKGG